MVPIEIIRSPVQRLDLKKHLLNDELVKGVVDLKRGIIAVGGELHADEEQVLLEGGSTQSDLWGFNLYLDEPEDSWIEYDSMINVRPRDGNRSRTVESPETQQEIYTVISELIT